MDTSITIVICVTATFVLSVSFDFRKYISSCLRYIKMQGNIINFIINLGGQQRVSSQIKGVGDSGKIFDMNEMQDKKSLIFKSKNYLNESQKSICGNISEYFNLLECDIDICKNYNDAAKSLDMNGLTETTVDKFINVFNDVYRTLEDYSVRHTAEKEINKLKSLIYGLRELIRVDIESDKVEIQLKECERVLRDLFTQLPTI